MQVKDSLIAAQNMFPQMRILQHEKKWKELIDAINTVRGHLAIVAGVAEILAEGPPEPVPAPVQPELPLPEPKQKAFKGRRHPDEIGGRYGSHGEMTNYIRDVIRDMPVGECRIVAIPPEKKGFPVPRFAGAVSAAAAQMFGAGKYTTALRPDGNSVDCWRTG